MPWAVQSTEVEEVVFRCSQSYTRTPYWDLGLLWAFCYRRLHISHDFSSTMHLIKVYTGDPLTAMSYLKFNQNLVGAFIYRNGLNNPNGLLYADLSAFNAFYMQRMTYRSHRE